MIHITIADILRAERDRRHKAYPELIAQGTLTREEANRRWCAFCTLLPRAGVATDMPPRYFVPFADALAEYERWLPELPIPAQVVVEHWLKGMQAPLRQVPQPAPVNNHNQPTLF